MQKAPSWFNTKQDIENSMAEYPQETVSALADLLRGRFFWERQNTTGTYILREDTTARIFLLGFSSIQEAESLLPPGMVIIPPSPPVPYYEFDSINGEWVVNELGKEEYLIEQRSIQLEEINSEYVNVLQEFDLIWLRSVTLGKKTIDQYKMARDVITQDYANRRENLSNG